MVSRLLWCVRVTSKPSWWMLFAGCMVWLCGFSFLVLSFVSVEILLGSVRGCGREVEGLRFFSV